MKELRIIKKGTGWICQIKKRSLFSHKWISYINYRGSDLEYPYKTLERCLKDLGENHLPNPKERIKLEIFDDTTT